MSTSPETLHQAMAELQQVRARLAEFERKTGTLEKENERLRLASSQCPWQATSAT